jgi:hypothetical protein
MMSDEEKLERRKRLKEESELPSSMADAANSSTAAPSSSSANTRMAMRAQPLWWKK